MVPIPSRSDVDYVELLAEERDVLLRVVKGLATDDWKRGTPCPGWSVLDLGAHLVGNDLGLLSRHRDGYAGIAGPDGADEGAFITWLDGMQDEWVRAARRLSPRLVIELLEWTGPRVIDTFGREDPTASTASVSWASHEPVPCWLDHARELSESWIHRQQIHEALEQGDQLDLDLGTPTAGAIVDALRWAYPLRLGSLAGRDDEPVEIVIDGPVARHWFLRAKDGAWSFGDRAADRVVARLAMTTDQAWRLLSNNLPPAAEAHLDLTGDRAVCDVLRRTRAIIGAPNLG